jgi:hypothetical protein
MRNGESIVIIVLFFLSLNTPSAYSLEVSTHETINERISTETFNEFSLDNHLRNNLGFIDGIREKLVNGQPAWIWISDGGRLEEKPPGTIPYLRSVNHYHDPTREQGFSGFFNGRLLSGYSLVEWAQMLIGAQSPGGHYSWNDARDYFYRALTSVNNEREKETLQRLFDH